MMVVETKELKNEITVLLTFVLVATIFIGMHNHRLIICILYFASAVKNQKMI